MPGRWEAWDSIEWNRALLFHYFSAADENLPGVSSISVSAEDLKIVTGDPSAKAEDVKDRFLDCVRNAIKGIDKPNNLQFSHALSSNRKHNGLPICFTYLYLTCMAANEILEDEDADLTSRMFLGDFREIMAELLEINEVYVGQELTEAWENLKKFLDTTPKVVDDPEERYWRKLILPPLGNETHIGYSKKLVFPSRRDQELLAKLIRDEELTEDNPPVESVVGCVNSRRRSFSATFIEAFDKFASAMRSGAASSALLQERFWAAVISICSNELLSSATGMASISILVELNGGGDQSFQLVASEGSVPARFTKTPTEDFDGWYQRILSINETEDPVVSLLAEPTGFGWLSGVVRGGVIPFVMRPDRFLEVSKPSLLHDSQWALIRRDCLDSALGIFNGNVKNVLEGPHSDWVFVSGLRMRSLSYEEVAQTELKDATILLKRIVNPRLKIESLFRIGSEYLGWEELLPKIEAPDADLVTLIVNGVNIDLLKDRDSWSIKSNDLEGHGIVSAKYGDVTLTKKIEFVKVPVSDEYKSPTNLDNHMVEINRGTSVFSEYLDQIRSQELHQIENSVHQIYLGATPGEFLNDSLNAVIKVTFFGNEVLPVILDDSRLGSKTIKVTEKNLVRKWRKIIEKTQETLPAGSEKRQKLSEMRLTNEFISECEPTGGFMNPPTPYDDDLRYSKKRDVLLAAAAARSLRSKGIPIGLWMEMLRERFKIDWNTARFVHRAWLDAGLIDELFSIRSPGVLVFARKPRMEIFQTEQSYVGAISGLVMPERLRGLRSLADQKQMTSAMNFGPCGMVPPHLRLRAESEQLLLDFASDSSLDVSYLTHTPFPEEGNRESGSNPILGFFPCRSNPVFNTPSETILASFQSNRSPKIWTVKTEMMNAWSYSQAQAEHLACQMAGRSNLRRISSVDIAIDLAFIPLTAARWIVAVSGVPSGQNAKNQYTYRFPSPEMTDRFIDYYQNEKLLLLDSWRL
jgi:hypothetical protein